MKGFFKKLIIGLLVFFTVCYFISVNSDMTGDGAGKIISDKTVLQMDMRGVILNGKKFLKNFKKYAYDPRVKAVVLNINSPGGAVGPSQELYTEIKRFRDTQKKPVVCVSTGVIASGAYYAAAGCSKIVVAPGAMVGSIGVIMEFANLQGLYDWAKVSRYSIKSGQFKDSGAEYRPMREDEKKLFQNMIDEVYAQFRNTIAQERKLSDATMTEYADGRVFTGSTAVKAGFADKEGFLVDGVELAAELANLGKDFEVYELPKKKVSIFDIGTNEDEDDLNSLAEYAKNLMGNKVAQNIDATIKHILRSEFLNQPMLLMPGFWE